MCVTWAPAPTPSTRAYRVIGALAQARGRLERAQGRTTPHFESEPHPINLNVGKIEGGDWASSVPAWCRVDCRISIFPGVGADEARREIEQAISAFARDDAFLANNPPRVTFNGFLSEGYSLAPGSRAEATLAEAHQQAFGKPLGAFTSAAYLDARVYALYDQHPRALLRPDRAGHPWLRRARQFEFGQANHQAIALFIADWCGVEAVDA